MIGVSQPPAKTALNAEGAAPIFAARAWVLFDASGAVAILGSGNVASVVDNGSGDFTINFETDMPHANYAVIGGGGAPDASNHPVIVTPKFDSPQTVSSVRIKVENHASNNINPNRVSVVVFG